MPTDANLPPAYDTFGELANACLAKCEAVNSPRHRATGQIAADRIAAHCPDHSDGRSVQQTRLQPRSEAEITFVGIGPGAGP